MIRNLVDILMDDYASYGSGVAGLRIYGKWATTIYDGDGRRYINGMRQTG